jgi:hypothetical protein
MECASYTPNPSLSVRYLTIGVPPIIFNGFIDLVVYRTKSLGSENVFSFEDFSAIICAIILSGV